MSGDYKVSIALSAKVADYVRGIDGAAKVTDKLRNAQQSASRSSTELAAALTATGVAARTSAGGAQTATRTTQGLASAQAKLGDSQRDVSTTSRAVARDTKSVADAAGAATTRVVSHGKAVTSLNARISATTSKIQGMAAAFAQTADPKILDGLKKQQSALRDLQSVKGLLSPKELSGSLEGGISSFVPAIAAAAVGASPLIGATIAGAVVGGAGIGGVIGGLALVAKDPRVKQAGTSLASDVMGDLEHRAKVFITPALQGIDTLRHGYAALGPELDRVFGNSAKLVAPLAAGAVKGVSAITRGVADAVAKSGPVINAVGDAESRIGAAVGQSLTDLSAHAGEGASAIERITADTVQLIGATTQVVGALSTVYGWFDNIDKKIHGFSGAGVFENLLSPIPGVGLGIQWLEDYVSKTGDAKVASQGTATGLAHVGAAAAAVKPTLTGLQVKQAVLNGTMMEGITAAGGLAQALKILNGDAVDAVDAEIRYQQAIDDVTAARKANGRSLQDGTTKGRANLSTLTALARAVEANADAVYRKAGGDEHAEAASKQATAEYERGRQQLVRSAQQFTGTKASAEALVKTWLKQPPNWKLDADTSAAKRKLKEAQAAAATAAAPRTLNFGVHTGEAIAKSAALKKAADKAAEARRIRITANAAQAFEVCATLTNVIGQFGTKTITLNVHTNFSSANAAEHNQEMQKAKANAAGGIYTRAAASGLVEAQVAPPGTRYQWAEPETGGEAFIPRLGDQARGMSILDQAAGWYGGKFVKMRNGGITAAASGLVSVAPNNASRLDSAMAYLQTRDAITSLNDALKKNGHAFSTATAKGRENQGQLFSAIKAAQDAAKTKFDETGNVRLANAAYDAYILRLRQTLVQQKVNRAAIRGLLSFADRPTFAASDSHLTIAAAKSQIGAQGALADLRDSLSLNRPTLATMSKEGRDNLSSILGFIEAAGSAAQDQYAQTGSAKTASALYLSLIAELRSALKANGYSATVIAGLVSRFGRISLVPNAEGGVYGPGDTLYQFREPSTGGEAFLPRRGDRARGERILQIGAGWYGGQYTPGGGSDAGGASYASNMTVNNYGEPLTVAKVQQVQRAADVHNRVGRKS